MRTRLEALLRRTDGPLTRELLREPGGHGLGQLPAGRAPDRVVTSVCGFCSTGCSLDVHLRDGEAVGLTPTVGYAVNDGMACPKGWESLTPLRADTRATTPLLRDAGGRQRPVGWSEAVDAFVGGLRGVQQRHGPASVAFLSTGQIPTEEMALLGAVAKFGMGMVHGDGNTRQCMATAVQAYKESFGSDAPPYTYADLEASDVVVLVGANPAIAHPILWERLHRNPHAPAVIVVDPRRTETAAAATQHLAVRPKADLELLYGLGHLLIGLGAVDEDFVRDSTHGYAAYADHVAGYPPERVAAATGIPVADLERCARTIAAGRAVSFWWTMGVNQSHQGTRTAQAVIDLALLTGNIGRPGTGANSITGQCNAMGSRLFSNTTSLLGGRDFTRAADRAEVAEVLGLDAACIPDRPSLPYHRIVEGIANGQIRGLWIVATNTAHSWIGQDDVRDLLGRLDFLVVQDLYTTTDTAQLADLVLPAAGWGEKEGTFINSERRIGRVRKVARAPGLALADFAIFRLLAEAWGVGGHFRRWSSPEAVFGLLQELSRGRPCDFSGIDGYADLEAQGGIQWPQPVPGALVEKERRLFADGVFHHPDGRARFVVDEPRPPAELVRPRRPLVLLTGRGSSAEWHTGTRTSTSPALRNLVPADPYVEVAPADAAARAIVSHDWVELVSERGTMRARALVTPTIATGSVFVSMHHVDTNRLTMPSFDPHSHQPAYKHAAVEVRRVHD
ncbi:molybdopterin oxidoreductase family protein [Egicoccus halophilus]|uniref:Nitrate reductase catalytic subunit n=1 Tax=Egicoccus halophilus TaxID=1670830 RepID=A0A8J3ACH1_9ACTN|nr:molybdopterin oxidoreductase family protein [Egicoccus halophilus]GGI08464.1 nitrate reductase catalytic subunit [Egicoccus halophilus]